MTFVCWELITFITSALISCMELQEVGRGRGDWMELAQDRDGWRAVVGTVRNFRVLKMRGIS